MRAASLSGSATAGFSSASLVSISLSILQALPIHALSFNSVTEPHLDLSPLGRVALTGDFNAVSIYSYAEQGKTASTNHDGQSILTPLPNGELTALSSSDAQIRAMCPFTRKDGTYEGIFVGGNFTKLGGVDAKGVALYKPDSNEVTALPGLSGSVSTLLCDQETNSVYVGGYFKYKNTSNAIAWVGGEGWTPLPFDGLNGPVASLLKNDDGHIIFGGSFDGTGNSTSPKKKEQIINLKDSTITSDAVSSRSGLSSPHNIICQTSGEEGDGKTWLLADTSPGFWRADMGFDYQPTKLRLWNTHLEGRGTKAFLFRRLPDNGIMNLTYTDPNSGEDIHCDSYCSLSDSKDEKYRDFTFVNVVDMRGFQLEILEWYGSGAGLNGIELFQEEIFAYAVDTFNEPSCAGIKYPSKSTQTGSWSTTKSGQSLSDYLTAEITDSTAASTSVVFEPDVKQSGNYTVLLYTPGCIQDGTCGSRGVVNVTATVSSKSDEPTQNLIHQTNLYEKYDTIYTGHVDAGDKSFRPKVTLTPATGQGAVTIVASAVEFLLVDASDDSSGELNGLFEYDPTSKAVNTNITQSAINRAGMQLESGAYVKALAKHDNIVYAGGNFSDPTARNLMILDDGHTTAVPGGGLNSEVSFMAVLDDSLYVGGNFTEASDGTNQNLKHVAAYSFNSKTWYALGGGVNGPVSRVIPLQLNASTSINETVVGVSGDFDKLLAFGNESATDVSGFAVWVPSHKNWLENLNISQIIYGGQLSAFTKDGNTTILAGSLVSGGIAAAGAVAVLYDEDLNLVPLLTKANGSDTNTQTDTGTYTGVYDTSSGRNLTILGGHFTTTATDGSSVKNLAILDGADSSVRGIGSAIDTNSTFLALTVSDDILFAGGSVTGHVGDSMLNGFLAYDLRNGSYVENVPPPFTGKVVSVNAIVSRPGMKEMYFGGNFETAGALPCPAVCFYDTTEAKWNRPGLNLYGDVLALKWISNKQLIAVGNLTVSGDPSLVATYNAEDKNWKTLAGPFTSDVSGTVTAFTPASPDVSKFWLAGEAKNGSSFLANYDGSKFQFAGSIFSAGTTIRGLEVVPLSEKHHDTSLLKNDQTLLITGQLVIPDFGNASAAFFNGTTLTPFIMSSKSDGQSGSMSQLFYENNNPYTSGGNHHSNGIVVLVAFCCALGCVFLIVIAGVIFNKIQRRRQGYMRAPQAYGTDRPSTMRRVPPEYLFNSLKQRHPGAPVI
ncbi:putative cellular morphogenesis protein (Rax2) [Aspergillus clavatus NRRL 1]|uniref:Cellular morphogenesis protein (Rax2), putative n=1 Tax=Aspergillus clavatus (strain ATCC 1007 / CBS 513.65 / DSM 816 / NCTC 3887 / NRRL 1 / QM 1276 / 107) TaxID=344612 RepID=A1CDL8_ASPCL|nr:cellular morphogenesis protein (Rax2), putative [Aspergillus clavatus NRRL 1]EAW11945.1 cellular morphogenesis protein (Rax2), putative [Aspergillus clavatus NRRL 1]